MKLEGKTFVLDKNSLLIFNLVQPKCYYSTSNNWNIVWYEFKIDRPFFETDKIYRFDYGSVEKSLNKFIVSELRTDVTTRYVSSLYAAILALWFKDEIRFVGPYAEKMEQVVNRIKTDYADKDISVVSLAASTAISERQFRKIFQKYMNVNVSDYITETRMKAACFLLVTTNDSLEVVAEKSGYSDAYYFSKKFKKIFTLSPREYRKQKQPAGEKSSD